jgi:hypothetical protein
MYIEQDFAGPAALDLMANRKMRNRILRYWPKTVVNGVECLDKLYLYHKGGGVQQSENHNKLYNILGIKIKDLQGENWKGIDAYWIYFRVEWGNQDDLTVAQLLNFVDNLAPLTVDSTNIPVVVRTPPVPDASVWYEVDLEYEPIGMTAEVLAKPVDEVLAYIKANPRELSFAEEEDELTAIALLDETEEAFERKFRIVSIGLVQVVHPAQTSKYLNIKYIKNYKILMEFRRKPKSVLAETAYLSTIVDEIAANNEIVRLGSIDIKLRQNYADIVPFIDTDIILGTEYSLVDDDGLPLSFRERSRGAKYYKVAGLTEMKAREFNKTITARITTDFRKEKVKFWKKLLTAVITIVIIVVAIWFALPTGGNSLYAAAAVLSAGSLGMMAISIVIAKHDPAWGAYIGKAATTLGVLASIVGVMNIVNNMIQALGKEMAKEAAKEAAKKAALEAGKDVAIEAGKGALKEITMASVVDMAKEMSMDQLGDVAMAVMKNAWASTTSMNLTNVLSWVTKGFQYYVKSIDPPDEGLAEKANQLAEQQKQLEDLTGPTLKDKIDYAFSSPHSNIYDVNEYMQTMPYAMTQGRIDASLSKYYDAVTSSQKYKGYIG